MSQHPPPYPGIPITLQQATSCSRCRRDLPVSVGAFFYTDDRGFRQIECQDCRHIPQEPLPFDDGGI